MSTTLPYIPEATDCRSCGICLSHCPTFGLRREEIQSPRGRIRLIERLLTSGTPLSTQEQQALRDCLQCRACETVCPSKMAYGELIDLTMARLDTPSSTVRALLQPEALQPKRLNAIAMLLQGYQRLGLQWLVRHSPLLPKPLRRLDALLPNGIQPSRWQPVYPAQADTKGRVALFTGCLGSPFDHATRTAAIDLLTRMGYEVHIPAGQQCCGAIHAHNGKPEVATRLAQANLAAFGNPQYQAVLYCDTGCGAKLSEYPRDQALPADASQRLHARLQDITGFIAARLDQLPVTPASLASTVAIHQPCSHRHPLALGEVSSQLLGHIPWLKRVSLPDQPRCCGAGGVHMLTTPELADPLREQTLEAIRDCRASQVVSTNIGCLLHLGAGLRQADMAVEILHPVTLLARQVHEALSARSVSSGATT